MKTRVKIKNGEIVQDEGYKMFLELNEGKFAELSPLKASRTDQQNKALHVLFGLWAQELNDAGYSVQLVLKESIDISWDMQKVKDYLWRTTQQAILGKTSTTELSKQEDIDKVYEHLNRFMGEKFGIHVGFPVYKVDKDEAPLREDYKTL